MHGENATTGGDRPGREQEAPPPRCPVCNSEITRIEQLDGPRLMCALYANTIGALRHLIGDSHVTVYSTLAVIEERPEVVGEPLGQRILQDCRTRIAEVGSLITHLSRLTGVYLGEFNDLPVAELGRLHETLNRSLYIAHRDWSVALDKLRDQGLRIQGNRYYLFAAAVLQEILYAIRACRGIGRVEIGYDIEGPSLVGTAVLAPDPSTDRPFEFEPGAWNRLRVAAAFFNATVESTRAGDTVLVRWTFPTYR